MLVRAVLINLLLLSVVISAPEKAEGLSCEKGITTAFHEAVLSGDISLLVAEFEKGRSQWTVRCHGRMVKVLTRNMTDEKGRTPIAIAVELGNLEIVKFFLWQNRIDLVRVDVLSLNNRLQNEEKNKEKENTASSVMGKGERHLSDIRDEIRMRIEREHFLRIVTSRDLKRITSLFEKGVDSKSGILLKKGGFDINYQVPGAFLTVLRYQRANTPDTALTALDLVMYSHRDNLGDDWIKKISVSSQNFIKLLEYLLDKGANMNARSDGETPLMRCRGACYNVVKKRRRYFSEVSTQYYKYFPGDLKTLMSSPCADAIEVFAKRPEFKIESTRPEEKWVSGWMLGVLAEVNRLKTIKFLVEKKGLRINKDILSYISRRTSKKTLEYLFKKGSGIELNPRTYSSYEPDGDMDSVLSYLVDTASRSSFDDLRASMSFPTAAELSDSKIIKLLKERGEYVDAKETIKFLVEKGARC